MNIIPNMHGKLEFLLTGMENRVFYVYYGFDPLKCFNHALKGVFYLGLINQASI